MPEAFGYAAEFTPGVYENVAAAKNYFDSVMDTLRSSLIQEVKELFGSSKSKRFEMTSLASVIKDWCEVLDTTVFEQLFPDGTEKCLMLFRSVTNDEDTFIARLAKIATDLRLEDWDDSTHGRFTRNVSRYKDTAEQYHAKAEEKTKRKQKTIIKLHSLMNPAHLQLNALIELRLPSEESCYLMQLHPILSQWDTLFPNKKNAKF